MKIAVLCGGLSPERNVSISSGTKIAGALQESGHQVVLLDMFFGLEDYTGDIAAIFDNPPALGGTHIDESAPDLESVRAQRKLKSPSLFGEHVLEVCAMADIVFLALHGRTGEDGRVQATLDLLGIPYTGSGYLGSALAMNKELSKVLFRHSGIPIPAGIVLEKGAESYNDVGFPCVVKPCSGGSSVGTSIVYSRDEYDAALEFAFRFEARVLVERYVKGRELTVGVMDGRAMPVIEIIPKSGWYDYKNKYQAGLTEELCPAPLSPEDTDRVQRLAERVAEALMIDVYCRADFLMDESDGQLYCLEANTLPGMTPTSLVPQMGAAQGMDFGEVCEKIIAVSMEKYK